MLKSPYVVAIGPVFIDEYLEMQNWPTLGDKAVAKPKSLEMGGMISNFCCNIADQGIKVYLLNHFSGDKYLAFFRRELKKFNVDYSHSRIDKYSSTNKCIVANIRGERTILVVTENQPVYVFNSRDMRLLQNAKYLYSTITDLQHIEGCWDVLRKIKEHGVKLVLDIEASTFQSHIEEKKYFDAADILIFNEFGFRKYSKGQSKIDIIKHFQSTSRLVVITKGSDGYELITKDEIHIGKGEEVEVVDTTGSGDMFNATFLAEIINGTSPAQAAILANSKAAEHATYFGPKTRIGTKSTR